ncbi:hypothetical protein ACHAW6_006381 [Cyclotella cf. meneghiniana]
MKSVFFAILLTATPATSFTPTKQTLLHPPPRITTNTALHAHSPTPRRTLLGRLALPLLALSPLAPVLPTYAIETYLTEPTEEFKESERQRIEFRKKQLVLKGEFVRVLARLTAESSTEEALVEDLTALRNLVVQTGGLPLGIKKEDMYKVIRSRKARGNWPTNVEIAVVDGIANLCFCSVVMGLSSYQKLKAEVAYQQSPNTEKDLENPL